MTNLEDRVSKLEFMLVEHIKFDTFLLSLVLRQDDALRLKHAECLRKVLIRPVEGQPLSPYLRSLLQGVRESLLSEADPKLAEVFSSPPVRLVE